MKAGKTTVWVISLLVLYLAQCFWFIRTQSLTYDEPVHLAEGLDAWRHGRFEQYNDHPPLARLLCTLPLLNSNWQIEVQPLDQGFQVSRLDPDPESMARRSRAMNVLLGLLLAFLLWRAAKRFYSRGAANFSLALFVFSPSLVAHFSLVTTDGAATLLIFVTAIQIVLWRRNPTLLKTAMTGGILGLLLLAKYSTLPMFALAVFWMLVLGREGFVFNPFQWNWGKTVLGLSLALLVVWAGYFFHTSRVDVHDGTLTATFPNWQEPMRKPVSSSFNWSVRVPAGEYVEGFRTVARHNSQGQRAFFLGTVSATGGWKLYHPIAILLKWPTVVLVLCLLGLGLLLRHRPKIPGELWIVASFPVVYFVLAASSRFSLGERHVLPMYTFALLFLAGLWEAAPRRASRLLPLLLVAVLLHAIDALRFAPAYLSYFDVFVRQQESYKLLSGSNLDWGQGLLAVRVYEDQHPTEQIHLAYFGSVDPGLYGIRAEPLPENQRVSGTVIVGATQLSGEYLADPTAYRWLLRYQPAEVLDHAMYVYKIGNASGPAQPGP